MLKVDAGALQQLGVGENIFHVRVAADGDDGRVLDEEQLIGDRAGFALLDQFALEVEGGEVAHAPEVANGEGRAVRVWEGRSLTVAVLYA